MCVHNRPISTEAVEETEAVAETEEAADEDGDAAEVVVFHLLCTLTGDRPLFP